MFDCSVEPEDPAVHRGGIADFFRGGLTMKNAVKNAIHPERAIHLPLEPNPLLVEHARQRAASVQNRIADQITTFAGSMLFVYIHLIWFGCWIGFGVEGYPYGLLTMIVSLEAIFLSTFVMISQNRADAKRQVIASQQWMTVQGRTSRTGTARPLEPDPQPDQGHPRPQRTHRTRRRNRRRARCRRPTRARLRRHLSLPDRVDRLRPGREAEVAVQPEPVLQRAQEAVVRKRAAIDTGLHLRSLRGP